MHPLKLPYLPPEITTRIILDEATGKDLNIRMNAFSVSEQNKKRLFTNILKTFIKTWNLDDLSELIDSQILIDFYNSLNYYKQRKFFYACYFGHKDDYLDHIKYYIDFDNLIDDEDEDVRLDQAFSVDDDVRVYLDYDIWKIIISSIPNFDANQALYLIYDISDVKVFRLYIDKLLNERVNPQDLVFIITELWEEDGTSGAKLAYVLIMSCLEYPESREIFLLDPIEEYSKIQQAYDYWNETRFCSAEDFFAFFPTNSFKFVEPVNFWEELRNKTIDSTHKTFYYTLDYLPPILEEYNIKIYSPEFGTLDSKGLIIWLLEGLRGNRYSFGTEKKIMEIVKLEHMGKMRGF